MKRPCLGVPGQSCVMLVDLPHRRCPTHRLAYNRQRGSATDRGYDAEWRRVSEAVLERDGYTCSYCGGVADTTDHVTALANGGARLDMENLVASCRPCNSSKGAK